MAVAVAAPSSEASLLEIVESRSLATISTSSSVCSVSSTSTGSSCGGGSGEGERVLFFRGVFRREEDFTLTAFFFGAMLADIVEYICRDLTSMTS